MLGMLELMSVLIVIIVAAVMVVVIRMSRQTGSMGPPGAAPLSRDRLHEMAKQIDALRDELKDLREASAQYGAAMERNVELLSERLASIEAKAEQRPEALQQRVQGEE